jgi:hypothetical protein
MELAVSYPEAIDHMIVHKTPTLSVVPDLNFYFSRLLTLYNTYHIQGAQAATAAFYSILQDREDGLPLSHPRPENAERWWANDVLLLGMHGPDLARVVDNKVSIAIATSENGKNSFYGQIAAEQEGILKCPRLVFPGCYQGFDSQAKQFAQVLIEAFGMLEKKRRSSVFELIFY